MAPCAAKTSGLGPGGPRLGKDFRIPFGPPPLFFFLNPVILALNCAGLGNMLGAYAVSHGEGARWNAEWCGGGGGFLGGVGSDRLFFRGGELLLVGCEPVGF